ncbi:MAG: twin-arginine translocase TatA/TatE family subunit [Candidatus Puniceispirillum sp.]|nr:twin-arginine translocase TatA/TatE family subunit [Candidatus Pelagibacter sp.]MBA4282753.1 twin-arginine translocase TatA/TatE family subunit [Candidatus Puniceispirillum sp.]
MGLSFSHLVIMVIVFLIIFGAGRMPQIMSDLAKGIKAFRDGMKDPE